MNQFNIFDKVYLKTDSNRRPMTVVSIGPKNENGCSQITCIFVIKKNEYSHVFPDHYLTKINNFDEISGLGVQGITIHKDEI